MSLEIKRRNVTENYFSIKAGYLSFNLSCCVSDCYFLITCCLLTSQVMFEVTASYILLDRVTSRMC